MTKPFLLLITQIRMIKFNFVVFNPKIELLFTNVLLTFHSTEKGLNQVIRQIKHETFQQFIFRVRNVENIFRTISFCENSDFNQKKWMKLDYKRTSSQYCFFFVQNLEQLKWLVTLYDFITVVDAAAFVL